MFSAVAIIVLAVAPVPPECEAPELRDVLALKQLAQLDGALSVGIDSVAAWCFDQSGAWTGGPPAGTSKTKVKAKADPEAAPQGDCAKAIASCEQSLKAVDKPALRELVGKALSDFDRPYRGQTYTPKRNGLKDKPDDKVDCASRERSKLYAMGQSRMDLARLSGVVQSEYSSYKAWLYARGLECRNEVAAAKRAGNTNTRLGVSIDAPQQPAPVATGGTGAGGEPTTAPSSGATGSMVTGTPASGSTGKVDAGALTVAAKTPPPTGKPGEAPSGTSQGAPDQKTPPAAGTATGAGAVSPLASADAGARVAAVTLPDGGLKAASNWVTERETALNRPMLEKWKYLAEQTAQFETDRDYTLGFLASRELRACDCTRPNPAAIVRSLEKKEGGAAGLALLESEDPSNTRCGVCALDAFPVWKARADRQCRQLDELTDYELQLLERSDDANGIPPRCFDTAKGKRAELAKAQAAKNPTAPVAVAGSKPDAGMAAPSAGVGGPVRDAGAVAALPMLPTATSVAVTLTADGGAKVTASGTVTPANTVAAGNPNLAVVNGLTYYKPGGVPDGGPMGNTPYSTAPMTGPGVEHPNAAVETFVPPSAWAPIPPREDGRMYVRLSMSAACVAEILPGPIQARTGDLLLVPYGAKNLSVKSPCGGLAEIYWGREPRPRFSEVFPRSQAIKFEFKPQ